MVKRLGCVISDDEKATLDRLTKELKMSQGEVISHLLKNYSGASTTETAFSLEAFELSSSQQQEVKEALINSDSQLNVVARDGLLQRSRYLNSIAGKQASLESMSDEEMSKATFKGAANFRIEQAISTITNHNDAQGDKSQKVCLTRGIVFKLTGSNRQTINKYFDEYELMISDHNSKHGLSESNNRKGKGFSLEQLLGLEKTL